MEAFKRTKSSYITVCISQSSGSEGSQTQLGLARLSTIHLQICIDQHYTQGTVLSLRDAIMIKAEEVPVLRDFIL